MLHQIGIGTLGPVFRTYEPTRDRLVAVKVFRLDIVPEQAQLLADALSRATECLPVPPVHRRADRLRAWKGRSPTAPKNTSPPSRSTSRCGTTRPRRSRRRCRSSPSWPARLISRAPPASGTAGCIRATSSSRPTKRARPGSASSKRSSTSVSARRSAVPIRAPERIDGGAWGTPADVFSLAAITFELLTARRPAGTGARPARCPKGSAARRCMPSSPARWTTTRRAATRRALAFAGALESAARGEPESSGVSEVAAIAAAPAVGCGRAAGRRRRPSTTDLRHCRRPHRNLSRSATRPNRRSTPARHSTSPFALNLDAQPRAAARLATRSSISTAEPTPGEFELDADARAGAGADAVRRGGDARAASSHPSRTGHFAEDFVEERGRRRGAPRGRTRVRCGDVPCLPAPSPNRTSTERSGPTILPYAVTLVLGLLGGFAAGYFVGSRDRLAPSPSPSVAAAQPAPAVGGSGDARQTRAVQRAEGDRSACTGRRAGRAVRGRAVRCRADYAARACAGSRTRRAPVEAPRPERIAGHLVVRSTPSRAAVTVNGTWRGRTPLTLDALPFGRYVVRVVLDGFNVAREEVSLHRAGRVAHCRRAPRTEGPRRRQPAADLAAALAGARRRRRRDPSARPARSTWIRGRAARPWWSTARPSAQTPLSLPDVAVGAHVVRIEMAGKKSWTSLANVVAGQIAASPARSRINRIDESNTRARKRHLVRRGRRRRARRDRRRSRLQHQHDRLPGNPDRPVLRRADRHDDGARDRQLRHRRPRTASRAARRSPASSSARSRRSPATGARTARCATTWSRTTSSRSPTSTRGR